MKIEVTTPIINDEEKKSLSLLHKLFFFTLGLLSAVTIYVLISLSNNLNAEKKAQAYEHFQRIEDKAREGQEYLKGF